MRPEGADPEITTDQERLPGGAHYERSPVQGLQGPLPDETRPKCRTNARCSTEAQDLTAQRDGLVALGVAPERIYVDHGLTGTNRERPGLREALAACRAGDTLVVTKLDRLARSLPDARAIADELTAREVALKLGGSVYDPTDAVGRLPFNVPWSPSSRPTSSGCVPERA